MTGGGLAILHVDMDAFYASVEQRDLPELRGKPVIVGGVSGRGVVMAASYEARDSGVHSAMPMTAARRLCPHAIVLPARMGHYAQIARQIREILLSFTPLVEPLSLDEAFLDVRGCERLFGPPPEIAKLVKTRVRAETGLIASVGVAPNKFLAKLASDLGKPDGLLIVPADCVVAFLAPLPVSRLWGVGAKAERRLRGLCIHTVGQLAAYPPSVLVDHFGVVGRHLWELAHGRDQRQVVPDREAKSVSAETTFARDINDRHALRVVLLELVEEVAGRLRQEALSARTVLVKVRSADFRTRTRSQSLPKPTNVTEALWHVAGELLELALTPGVLPLRLLGVGAAKVTRNVSRDLFDTDRREGQVALDNTVDAIRDRFGTQAIRRASLLGRSGSEKSPGAKDGGHP